MKKLLAVGVIVLFLGLAFAPSINANVSKASIDSELVEITTEICGLNSEKHNIQLTKDEVEEVKLLFDDIQTRLFNEAIVELDKYGLLGGLSVKQAQNLVTGGYNNPRLMKLYEFLQSGLTQSLDENENRLCLVAGSVASENLFFNGLISSFIGHLTMVTVYNLLLILYGIYGFIFWIPLVILMMPFMMFFGGIDFIKPFSLGGIIISLYGDSYGEGKISTSGSNGEITWEGKMRGGIDKGYITIWSKGFSGLKIQIPFMINSRSLFVIPWFFSNFLCSTFVENKNITILVDSSGLKTK